jgi:hypothetical protein
MAHIRNLQRVALPCNFEEHTTDLEENQILLWTLTRILESGICTERSLPHIRQARRALLGLTTLQPFSARACSDRLYNRLNQDYEPLHALCRFFLEHTGPTHWLGDRRMLPILINKEARSLPIFCSGSGKGAISHGAYCLHQYRHYRRRSGNRANGVCSGHEVQGGRKTGGGRHRTGRRLCRGKGLYEGRPYLSH